MLECWCGNSGLAPFSPDYAHCRRCGTLVSRVGLKPEETLVRDDDNDFYGRNYWFGHQSADLGFPTIDQRARSDLTERALAWLRLVLKYRLPPGRTLELGCAHGGFVSLLRHAGFDAAGLEMSPAIVEFAQRTFNVPMFTGPLGDQRIEAGSLDAVILMDVLEHLPKPEETMSQCVRLLKPDGLLVVQTPCFEEGKDFAAMRTARDPFLDQMKSDEHLLLFSKRAVEALMQRVGAQHVVFEQAYFAHYDMCFVAGRTVQATFDQAARDDALMASGSGRMVLAMLDLEAQRDGKERQFLACEDDRAKRGEQIDTLWSQLSRSEQDREARLEVIHRLSAELETARAALGKHRRP